MYKTNSKTANLPKNFNKYLNNKNNKYTLFDLKILRFR